MEITKVLDESFASSNTYPWENDPSLLDDKIRQAIEFRMPYTEHKAQSDSYGSSAHFISSDDPAIWKAYRDDYHDHFEYVEKSRRYVIFKDPRNFSSVLKSPIITVDKGTYEENYKHELEHWRQAKEEGFTDPVIGFYFLETPNGTMEMQFLSYPGTDSQAWSDKEFIEKRKRIFAAPTKLSEHDKKILGIEE